MSPARRAERLFFTRTQRTGKLSGLMEKVDLMEKVSDNVGVEGAR